IEDDMRSDKPSPTPAPDPSGAATRTAGRAEPGTKHPRLGRYELVKHLATGGMGAVYRARDTVEGRDVALKILQKEAASKGANLARFEREVRSAMKLCHENVVAVYESGEHAGYHYLVMEF